MRNTGKRTALAGSYPLLHITLNTLEVRLAHSSGLHSNQCKSAAVIGTDLQYTHSCCWKVYSCVFSDSPVLRVHFPPGSGSQSLCLSSRGKHLVLEILELKKITKSVYLLGCLYITKGDTLIAIIRLQMNTPVL